MADNTTGFKFSNDPSSPNSDASAENLNAAVEKAVVFNIGPQAVRSEHLHSNLAGAGLGGAAGEPLCVKTDGQTVEIHNDQITLVDAPIIGESRLVDNAVTMDKLADAVKNAIQNVLKTIYKVGDYFITHNSENPTNRFGGTWELCKDKFLLGAGGEYDILATGGEAEHTLTVEEMPKHAHAYDKLMRDASPRVVETYDNWGYGSVNTAETGGGQAHNNMPPYKAVYIWCKISDTDESEEA